MEGRWPRALLVPLTVLAWLAVLLVLGWLLSQVARTVLMIVLAVVIAFAVTPVVNFFGRFMPRVAALALTYLVALGIAVGLLGVIVVTVADEVRSLVHSIPVYAQATRSWEPQLVGLLSPIGV